MMSVPKNNGPIVDPALCRCCRAIKKCRILTAEYTWMGKKEIYADMVMDCYGILLSHVDGNERDSGVCATCVVRLREAIAFRHQVLQCEELFLHAKLENHDEEEEKDETKLKKFDLELKTEPKDYSSDHNSLGDRDEPCPAYSDDDAEDNKPLKREEPKAEEPPPEPQPQGEAPPADSSSDSDEPVRRRARRRAREPKADGAKRKVKAAKKQKAETGNTETNGTETGEQLIEIHVPPPETELPTVTSRGIKEPEIHMVIKVEPCSETSVTITETVETIAGTETNVTITETVETIAGAETGAGPETAVEKRVWVRSLTSDKTKYQMLCEEFESNEDLYFKHYNMSRDSFEELLSMLETCIKKELTNYRKPIAARQRLSVCLRYLKTGDSCSSISQYYGIGRSTAASIILDVSKAIWGILQPVYMPTPTAGTWSRCEDAFRELWKVPNCIGSVGGRHIVARSKVRGQPSQYSQTSSKRFTSAVFAAVADPFSNLILIDIGNYGTLEERGVFEHTSLYKDFLRNQPLLAAKPLPDAISGGRGGRTAPNEQSAQPHVPGKPMPHYLIGNEGMPSTTFLLREYPKNTAAKDRNQKIFNDRIRSARTVETAFDMLVANWQVFRRPIECCIERGVHFARAACCLHNYVKRKHGGYFGGEEGARGGRRAVKGLVPFKPVNGRAKDSALKLRDEFAAYFSGAGTGCVDELADVKVEPS